MAKAEGIVIPADDKNIQYSGRVDFSNPKRPRFDWPGVSITAAFEAKSCGVSLVDGENNYNIYIDGKFSQVLVTQKDVKFYPLKDLKKGRHVLTLSKRTEGSFGMATFEGLVLDKEGKILPPPKLPARKMEVIGDSITCGYGNEGPGLQCKSLRPYENVDLAYAKVLAGRLGAECYITAYSGKGVVRNYGEKGQTSPEPMPGIWERLFVNQADPQWDFKQYQPDLVVIMLGANDFSTEPHPDHVYFMKEYCKLLESVLGHYPKARILCLIRKDKDLGELVPWEEEGIKKFTSKGGRKIQGTRIDNLFGQDLGCDWHPTVKAHKRMADQVEPIIRKFMNW